MSEYINKEEVRSIVMSYYDPWHDKDGRYESIMEVTDHE